MAMDEAAVDRHAAARFLAERYGQSAAASVAELGGGDWSRAFSFCYDNRDLVARFGRHIEDFTKDQKAMAFALPGLPVPTVLDVGEAAPGIFYAISERHFGVFLETLDEQQWRRFLPALLRALDALREVPPPGGSGGADWASEGVSAPISWRQWLVATLEDRPSERVSGWRARLEETPINRRKTRRSAGLPEAEHFCKDGARGRGSLSVRQGTLHAGWDACSRGVRLSTRGLRLRTPRLSPSTSSRAVLLGEALHSDQLRHIAGPALQQLPLR
jgi:hygromycin-B 4-O-kinase